MVMHNPQTKPDNSSFSFDRYDRVMLAKERRKLIVNELNRSGTIHTSQLVTEFGVSDVTIRSDLDQLERSGRLVRTHGGAVLVAHDEATVAFDLRLAMHSEAKHQIALAAAELIRSNQSIILDAGTTTQHLAQVMPDVTNLTVYTPGITHAQQLLRVDGVQPHLLGGRIDPDWLQTIGTPREQGLKGVLVQTVFLGVFGIDEDLDIVDQSPAMPSIKQQYIRRARTVVVLADSTKIGKAGSAKVVPLERADIVITDNNISKADKKRLTERDIQLIIAE